MKGTLGFSQGFKNNVLVKIILLIKYKLSIRKVSNYKEYQTLFNDKCGIEIGGPSSFFIKQIPLYNNVKSLDGVNFSTSTVWEGELREGNNYKYTPEKTGYQYICDAVDLSKIETAKYDFVLSCNNLEHIANPFRALTEWLRILKPGGLLLLVLPDKRYNFDHNRKTTNFEHLVEDFKNNITEEDLTHLDEILEFHDLSMDPPSGDIDNFKKRSIDNIHNRCLHHHVFDMDLLFKILKHFNLEPLLNAEAPGNFVIVGRK